MLRYAIVLWLLGLMAFGVDFQTLRNLALKNSLYLQSNALLIDEAKLEQAKTTRYQNLSLEIEYSKFDQENGHRLNLSQPIRLWGVGDAREELAKMITETAKSEVKLTRAKFLYRLSELYLSYKEACALEKLATQEETIAKRVYMIAQKRYENGTIAKADMLQAKLAYTLAASKVQEKALEKLVCYYDLLAFSGINEEMTILDDYSFTQTAQPLHNPTLTYLKSKKSRTQATAKLYGNKVEWINLYAEWEAEPEVDIYRVGLGIPLPLFNDRSEEKQQAKLQAKAEELIIKNYQSHLDFQLVKLSKSLQTLNKLIDSYRMTLDNQQELLTLFEEGYKIASIDIVQIEQVKNALIETKRRLILARIEKERNINTQNYLKGNYNE